MTEERQPLYARVAVDLANRELDRPFSYRVPQDLRLLPGMRVFLPFGRREVSGIVMELSESCEIEPEKLRDVLRAADEFPILAPELLALAAFMQRSCDCTLAQALRAMLPAQLRSNKIRPLTRLAVRLVLPLDEALKAAGRAKRQQELLRLLEGGPRRLSLLEETLPGAQAVARALEKKGTIELFAEEVPRIPYKNLEISAGDFLPTAHQAQAIAAVSRAMAQKGGSFLLHGVTGSGKTEVYMHLIRRVLEGGRGAIVLVPEIALTPQMASWFRARFGDTAAILHSGLSDGERFDEWSRVREGRARVVVGARSAVFAPVENLGLLIVDEEHEGSYRSDTHPRYDAIELAKERCRLAGATLLLGSATPSVERFARALRGEYELLEMPRRVEGRPMAEVSVVDMRAELIQGNPSIFSRELRQRLEETLHEGGQALLFLNRRGYAGFIKCRACGASVKCAHCDVSMTYHRQGERLVCHYCGAERGRPAICPACGSAMIKPFGIGTQKVEELFQSEFPGAACLRMDADTVKTKDALVEILRRFRSGEAQVLIGTQMLAKGHDFPKVTLVGAMAADLSLNLPDFRSEERTFQLLTQVAGRAGRGEAPGHVVVQSYEPGHYAVQMAAKQDYRAFFEHEIKRRRHGLYPPYTKLLRVLLAGAVEGDVRAACEELAQRLKDWFWASDERRKRIVQLRPMAAPLGRLRDEFRWQLFAKLYSAQSEESLEKIACEARALEAETKGVRFDLELNPSSFL
ncbi:MAG: primosomal protein N' [Christensenellaceae bacterium]|jgi:primosomal protein N' (replication factor Y)|nr:primosomal protein N' [Christensenellaceae bacterium]